MKTRSQLREAEKEHGTTNSASEQEATPNSPHKSARKAAKVKAQQPSTSSGQRPNIPNETLPDSESDEAPEELSLASGKRAAETQLQLERETVAQAKQAAKERRRSRNQKAADEAHFEETAEPDTLPEADGGPHELLQVTNDEPMARSPEVGNHAQNSEAEQDNSSEAPLSAEEPSDVLPAGVIAALQRQAREKRRQQLVAVTEREQAAPESKRQKKERITERQAGPVTVKILDDKITAMPSVSAVDFARQRLFGARLKRSIEMLQPVKTGKDRTYRPAAGFARGKH